MCVFCPRLTPRRLMDWRMDLQCALLPTARQQYVLGHVYLISMCASASSRGKRQTLLRTKIRCSKEIEINMFHFFRKENMRRYIKYLKQAWICFLRYANILTIFIFFLFYFSTSAIFCDKKMAFCKL